MAIGTRIRHLAKFAGHYIEVGKEIGKREALESQPGPNLKLVATVVTELGKYAIDKATDTAAKVWEKRGK